MNINELVVRWSASTYVYDLKPGAIFGENRINPNTAI